MAKEAAAAAVLHLVRQGRRAHAELWPLLRAAVVLTAVPMVRSCPSTKEMKCCSAKQAQQSTPSFSYQPVVLSVPKYLSPKLPDRRERHVSY